jgi:hypothetical protein
MRSATSRRTRPGPARPGPARPVDLERVRGVGAPVPSRRSARADARAQSVPSVCDARAPVSIVYCELSCRRVPCVPCAVCLVRRLSRQSVLSTASCLAAVRRVSRAPSVSAVSIVYCELSCRRAPSVSCAVCLGSQHCLLRAVLPPCAVGLVRRLSRQSVLSIASCLAAVQCVFRAPSVSSLSWAGSGRRVCLVCRLSRALSVAAAIYCFYSFVSHIRWWSRGVGLAPHAAVTPAPDILCCSGFVLDPELIRPWFRLLS